MIGDELPEAIPPQADRRRAQREVRHLLHPPGGRRYAGDAAGARLLARLLGQNVIQLADLDAVCETIALTVGLGEEADRPGRGPGRPGDVGSAAGPAVSRALAAIGSGRAARAGRRLRAGSTALVDLRGGT